MKSNHAFFTFLFKPIGISSLLMAGLVISYAQLSHFLALPASLEINKSVNVSSINSGEAFIYTIDYRCASLVEDCMATVITDPLPPEVEYIGLQGSAHTINDVYDPGTHTVTFTFQNILMAGTTGQVEIEVRFPNGTTPNNAVALNTATLSASNAPSVSSSASTTAIAEARPFFFKYLAAGGIAGEPITWGFELCNGGYSNQGNLPGTLDLTNVVIRDTFPPGTILDEYNNQSGVSGTLTSYDPVTGILEFAAVDLSPNECIYPRFSMIYPDPPYGTGSTITNTGYVYSTPIGETPIVNPVTEDYEILPTTFYFYTEKNLGNPALYPGETSWYSLDFENSGNAGTDDFCVADTIPTGVEITSIQHGGYYYGGLTGPNDNVNIYYTTNLNPAQLVPGSPFSRFPPYLYAGVDVENDLGLVEGGPEYITSIEWCFGDMPPGFGIYYDVYLNFRVRDDAVPGIVTNCMELNSSSADLSAFDSCEDLEILAANTGIAGNVVKNKFPPSPSNPGDTIEFRIIIRNEVSGLDDLSNPIIYDLLPTGYEYIPGTWYIPSWANLSGYPDPAFSFNSDFNNTGQELLSWQWTGANGIDIPPDDRIIIGFDVKIPDVAIGGESVTNRSWAKNEFDEDICEAYSLATQEPDIYDLDLDGDTTELFCIYDLPVNISSIVSIESEKLTKGQLDTVWTKFPDIGSTVPGGNTDYQLRVENTGTVPFQDIVVVDILPHVSDISVVTLNQRDSRWQPNLVGPVSAPPGIIVYYSTAFNPCRSAEGIVPSGPAGCTPAGWSTSPPLDITTVQSLKFEFGSTILNPGQAMILEWPMRAPVNVLAGLGGQPDSIAWNSFGFVATRMDNGVQLLPSEPLKVGINVEPSTPGVYGDFVWLDANQNGIQELGELGENGVRVELYKDDGDGIQNIALDTFVNFTVSANGGFYLFPNLPTGDYYSVFYLPPTFLPSPDNVGGNDLVDSDGIPTVYNNTDIAFSPITTVNDTDFDYSWDMGIFQSNLGAIGNYVWNDLDSNGIQDESILEGVNGVTVNLFEASNPGVAYASTVTTNDFNGNPGHYLFNYLPPGNYYLGISVPTGSSLTNAGGSGSDVGDSDFNPITTYSETFAVSPNVYDDSWDAGLLLSPVEICTNGIDDDGDGLVDCADIDCLAECDPCYLHGNDTDGDGICDNLDCNISDPQYPGPPGESCDDFDINTINDEIQSDSCTCVGDPCYFDGITVSSLQCFDNGTLQNPLDDYFTVTINVSGMGAGWQAAGVPGLYNQDKVLGPFQIYMGDFDLVITNECNQTLSERIVAPPACSVELQCPFEAYVSEGACCRLCPDGNLTVHTTHASDYIAQNDVNLTDGKVAYVSSRVMSIPSNPNYAIDGNTDGNYASNPDLVISAQEVDPWWDIDLFGNFTIESIHIYGRTDCCASTSYNYEILVSPTPFTSYDRATSIAQAGVSMFPYTVTGGTDFIVSTTSTTARFVRIYLNGDYQMQLAEVEIIGDSAPLSQPFIYNWSDPTIGNTATPSCLSSGTYTVTVIDVASGCAVVETVVVP